MKQGKNSASQLVGLNLDYFAEWGGHSWANLCRQGLLALGDLHGKTVLEIGPRFGKMSSCLALLGAKVVGVEIDGAALRRADEETRKWGVTSDVSFVTYDGNLDRCHALDRLVFDVVFVKSVLVLLGESLPDYLQQINRKLKPDGKCVFIENGHGGPLFSLLREIRPTSRGHRGATYMRRSHLSMMNEVFNVADVKRTWCPPIYLIVAEKKCHQR
jgi:SAM-dependent methyltransferase